MRTIAVLMLLGLCATGSAFGAPVTGPITVNGNLDDWGVTVDYTAVDRPDADWAPNRVGYVAWWAEDTTCLDGQASKVGPGYGGQNFDVEAAYMTSSDGRIYGAFVSGFDKAGQRGWGGSGHYVTGDLFFDIGNDDTWDFAIALSSHVSQYTYMGKTYTYSFKEGDAYAPTVPGAVWYTTPSDFPESVPAQLAFGKGFSFTDVTSLLDVEYAYTEGAGLPELPGLPVKNPPYPAENQDAAYSGYSGADHNIVEVGMSNGALVDRFGSTKYVLMHYTEECGNDSFDVLLPEPGTCVLALGAVLAGAYARRRRKGERTDAA